MPLRDRTQLEAAKARAHDEYRQALGRATGAAAVQEAATTWLAEVNRLNRAALLARQAGSGLASEYSRLEASIRRLEVEADASRIRAEAALERCNEARRTSAQAAELADDRAGTTTRLQPGSGRHEPVIALLLRGDRGTLDQVAQQLATETGRDAARLQQLLIELSEQIAHSALDGAAIRFAEDRPFWSQFESDEARRLASTLAQLGYRYDGHGGWLDGRVPAQRHLAMALAHAGLDNRIRRPLSQAEIDDLWRGSTLESIEHVARNAPDLSLDQLQALLATRAAALDELWDTWPSVRRALLS